MTEQLHQGEDDRFIPMTSIAAGSGHELSPDLYYYTQQIVNVVFAGNPSGKDWVLIDAGMPKGGNTLISVAEKRFPNNPRPSAIILTHGHFDHVGGIVDMIEKWDVPVFAHPLEFPFLDGSTAYPEPDSTVEGGLLAKISGYYPHQPVNIASRLNLLPADGTVPGMPGWIWVHTPGHSPGHVSLFRKADRMLVAGDAFVTVRTDEFYKTLVQKKEVNGPPRYLTTDWNNAYNSVVMLQSLNPETAVTGHGQAMQGSKLKTGLSRLMENFREVAVPSYGRFVPRAK